MKNRYLAKLASGAAITTLVLAGGSTLAFAQTTSGTGSTSVTGTTTATTSAPTAPNTGAGGDAAANLALLGISALALVGGGAYLARQRFIR